MPQSPKYFRARPNLARRIKATDAYYQSAAWRKLRRMQLARQPWCSECNEPATTADHVVPRNAGGSDSFDNLDSLCTACHSRKTVAHDGGFGR